MNVPRVTPIVITLLAVAACGVGDGASTTEPSATAGGSQPADTAVTGAPSVGAAGERIPVIVDYSPTTSDVAALLYVTQHPLAELLAVTLAGTGESHCEQGVANTRALLASVGLDDLPVACGQEEPIGPGNSWPPDWREAADHLDGLDLPATEDAAEDSGEAADLLVSVAAEHAPLTIVALGPLTNLAVAIERDRDMPAHVSRVVTMGGALEVEGNATNGVAEWNYFVDPTAADAVLRSGIPVTLVPLDATNDVPVTGAWFNALAGHRTTPAADAVHDLLAAARPFDRGFYFWDELTAAVALDPTLATFDEQPIIVDVAGPEQGRTRIDAAGTLVRIARAADADRFESEFLTTLNAGSPPPEIPPASAEEADYFRAVEASALTLQAGLETLFHTPLAQEIEQIANRANVTDDLELGPAEEATLREFFTTFWTEAAEHVAVHRDELQALDVPVSIRAEHAGYVAALGALIDSTDARLADIETRDAAELPGIFREPDEVIDTLSAACEMLAVAASQRNLDSTMCP